MISISHFDNPYVLQQWEGLIELLGSESKPAGGLEFLHKYEHPLLSLLSYFHTFIYLLTYNFLSSNNCLLLHSGIEISKNPFRWYIVENRLMLLDKL